MEQNPSYESRYFELKSIIECFGTTSHFQPIISLKGENVFGYESLCRLPEHPAFQDIEKMFQFAHESGLTYLLDMCCRTSALELADYYGLQDTDSLLFVNICPSTLLHPDHSTGKTEELCQKFGIDKSRVVLEITEQEAVHNYQLFSQAIRHYRDSGFKIAIDDFGAGYGGLKMLSVLEPDFVKIDKHFFCSGSKAKINFTLIDSIFTACHRIGISVIAEGIETQHHLDICQKIGIDLVQGYYFCRPSPGLVDKCDIPIEKNTVKQKHKLNQHTIGSLVKHVVPVSPQVKTIDLFERLHKNPDELCVPVVEDGRVHGLVNRHRFMEKNMVGRLGYGLNLNYYKNIADVIEESFLQVPDYFSIEDTAQKIHSRPQKLRYDDVCITQNGRYVGTVSVHSVLNAVTQNSINYAKGANPLTGLPGNEFILRTINDMLAHSVHFDVCYIDIDNFKPYNDRHGFEMGDKVIKYLGEVTEKIVEKIVKHDPTSFVGHIGGDDFIFITRPKNSVKVCGDIIAKFTKNLSVFHTKEECASGYYTSKNRQGKIKQFPLLSLSIGVVSTEIHQVESTAEISSLATDLKKQAKAIEGSVVIKDRRQERA